MDIVFKYFLVILCGLLIGLEREHKRKGLGYRSCIIFMVAFMNVFVVNQYLLSIHSGVDPARLYSYCLSSLSFLGAGIIIKTSCEISGLTTAISLYALLSVAMLVSVNQYILALSTTLIIYITLKFNCFILTRSSHES